MRDYEVHTRDRKTGRSKGWKKIAALPTHALYWLRDCDWSLPAPKTISRNEWAQPDDIRNRVEVELTARAAGGPAGR